MIFEDVALKAKNIAGRLDLDQIGVTVKQAEVVLLLAHCLGDCFTSSCRGCAVDHRLEEAGIPKWKSAKPRYVASSLSERRSGV